MVVKSVAGGGKLVRGNLAMIATPCVEDSNCVLMRAWVDLGERGHGVHIAGAMRGMYCSFDIFVNYLLLLVDHETEADGQGWKSSIAATQ
jgi:hypothetical protein